MAAECFKVMSVALAHIIVRSAGGLVHHGTQQFPLPGSSACCLGGPCLLCYVGVMRGCSVCTGSSPAATPRTVTPDLEGPCHLFFFSRSRAGWRGPGLDVPCRWLTPEPCLCTKCWRWHVQQDKRSWGLPLSQTLSML